MSKYAFRSLQQQETKYFTVEDSQYRLRMPIKKLVLTGEIIALEDAEYLKEANINQANLMIDMISISREIGERDGKSVEQVFAELQQLEINPEKSGIILIDHPEVFKKALVSMNTGITSKQKTEVVTIFMRSRGEACLNTPAGDEWVRTADWTKSDTESLESKALNELFQFTQWELNGHPEDSVDTGKKQVRVSRQSKEIAAE